MKPARTPPGEKPADTIAFLRKQVRDLAARIDTYSQRNAEANSRLAVAINVQQSMREENDKLQASLEACQAKLAYETAHASGYRQRVYDEKADMSKIAMEREKYRKQTDENVQTDWTHKQVAHHIFKDNAPF